MEESSGYFPAMYVTVEGTSKKDPGLELYTKNFSSICWFLQIYTFYRKLMAAAFHVMVKKKFLLICPRETAFSA